VCPPHFRWPAYAITGSCRAMRAAGWAAGGQSPLPRMQPPCMFTRGRQSPCNDAQPRMGGVRCQWRPAALRGKGHSRHPKRGGCISPPVHFARAQRLRASACPPPPTYPFSCLCSDFWLRWHVCMRRGGHRSCLKNVFLRTRKTVTFREHYLGITSTPADCRAVLTFEWRQLIWLKLN
jgi:hypothetical protein